VEPIRQILRKIVGSELSTVVFVRDYLQLAFEPAAVGPPDAGVLRPPMAGAFASLSAYAMPEIHVEGRHLRSGDAGYLDALVAQIGRRVTDADDNGFLRLEFDSGALS
jgi:hypothetical protein